MANGRRLSVSARLLRSSDKQELRVTRFNLPPN
jgi:hypothetical protein